MSVPPTPLVLDRLSQPPATEWRRSVSRAVHPSARTDDRSLLVAVAEGLAAVAAPWELTPAVNDPRAESDCHPTRSFELLLETDVYDAWLIHWPAGTGLAAHDHAGSAGAFAVVDGILDEDTMVDGGVVTTTLGPGDVVEFDEHHLHAVVNRSERGVTSVHVYSPPLRSTSFRAGEVVVDTASRSAA